MTETCRRLGLPFKHWHEASSDGGSAITMWAPGMEQPVSYPSDHFDHGRIFVDVSIVESALELLEAGKLDDAVELLEGALPIVLNIPLFEVVEDAIVKSRKMTEIQARSKQGLRSSSRTVKASVLLGHGPRMGSVSLLRMRATENDYSAREERWSRSSLSLSVNSTALRSASVTTTPSTFLNLPVALVSPSHVSTSLGQLNFSKFGFSSLRMNQMKSSTSSALHEGATRRWLCRGQPPRRIRPLLAPLIGLASDGWALMRALVACRHGCCRSVRQRAPMAAVASGLQVPRSKEG